MRIFVLLLLLTVVGGCVHGLGNYSLSPEAIKQAEEQQRQIQEAYKNAVSECEKTTWQRKTAYKKQECLNRAEEKKPYQSLDGDVRKALGSVNLETALNYAEGKISKDRFLFLIEQNKLRATFVQNSITANQQQIEAQRLEAERQRRAAAWQQFGQAMQNYSNQMQQQQQFQQQQMMINNFNRPRHTNCNSFGNSLNCTTY